MNATHAVAWIAASLLCIACEPPPLTGGGEGEPTTVEVSRVRPYDGHPPAAPPYPESLESALAVHLSVHAGTPPRTQHTHDDGRPRFTNRLALDTSPYLRQHAHNPVDWFPWGAEAFERARELDRPVLLSIGYSTCHWCHVMAEESFDDLEIATYLNQRFVAIKVDRETRPDIDAHYQRAIRAATGAGGWPATLVLTPDREAFFAATYLPPRAGARGARTGFLEALQQLDAGWRNDRPTLLERAGELTADILRQTRPLPPGDLPTAPALLAAAERFDSLFDERNGGLVAHRKFPQPAWLHLVMRVYRRSGRERYLEMVTTTLDRMADGGIHDQIGGGFHRYTVDSAWEIPHFEKMLYDNAQLASVYLEGYQLTGDDAYADVTRRTLDYILREMTASDGTFFSATDADSEGEEGTFFIWTPQQIEQALEPELARFAMLHWGIDEEGNFEGGTTVLRVARSLPEVARLGSSTLASVIRQRDEARDALYDVRSRRISPHRDEKVITAWNALTISALARAAWVLDEPRYATAADRAMHTLMERAYDADGTLMRIWSAGELSSPAFLDDHAFLVAALLDLYEATHHPDWLRSAIELQDRQDELFWDPDDGGYHYTSEALHESFGVRTKPARDGAEPSPNGISALNLYRLATLTQRDDLRERARNVLRAFSSAMTRAPQTASTLLSALDWELDRPREILILTPDGRSPSRMVSAVAERFLPNRVLVVAESSALAAHLRLVPLLESKGPRGGQPTAWVCEEGRCEKPTSDRSTLGHQLDRLQPYDVDLLHLPGEPQGHEH